MFEYLDPILRRKRYLQSHFDDVISLYREKEMTWDSPPPHITAVWVRLVDMIKTRFGADIVMLVPHVIDLHQDGRIGL